MLRGESLRAPLLAIIHSPGKIITPSQRGDRLFFVSRNIG
jgi:hypothetical protein